MALNQSIYTTGGTVQAGGGIYLSRKADDELLQLCREGQFAYVLTPRQMGKSSLMVQTAQRLELERITSIIIDLTKIGTEVTAEQWYLGLLIEIDETLIFDTDIFEWWETNKKIGVTQRLTKFFEEVLLDEVSERIVVFIDEIDTTLGLEFTDDLFIAIRYFYTARAQKESFKRLSFVLIGVAKPGDLISDPLRTPFNIGARVNLGDFTQSEITPLIVGLSADKKIRQRVLPWILRWTGGHPYLTQRLCSEILNSTNPINSSTDVDSIVERTFLRTGSHGDSNLQFVRDMLTQRSPDQYSVLAQYKIILQGKIKFSMKKDQL
ncbi:MAG: AAA-like domain-containing protein [Cyanobacteria bacterium P01_A01_bin.116]